ncbi:MIT domain protein [Dictyocaulus viviparus]|uniref:MIT domain protein n=1 Tax=Dictyocaulus viviparus TaxID=29172 RepID=A0A0D8XHK1_DICVI|nr:MIT domain protein [Dictyocaulus viviparus]
MSNEEKYIEEAKNLLVKAVSYDKNEKPNDALRYYMLGIEKLDKAVKSPAFQDISRCMASDDCRKGPLYKQIAQYISRAELLKAATKIEVRFLEQRKIVDNSVGHGYDKIFGKCLDDKLTAVYVQDAYIIAHHQILNFIQFCELVVTNAPNIRYINLITGTEAKNNEHAFEELSGSFEKINVVLKVEFSAVIHDREIRFNNGWIVKIGRGLDYFKKPGKYVLDQSQAIMTKTETSKAFNDYKMELFKEAERIVMEEFPKKVIEYDSLLKTYRFSYARLPEMIPNPDLNIPVPNVNPVDEDAPVAKKLKLEDVHGDNHNGVPVYGFINGNVPCNSQLADLMDQIRPLLRDAVENVNKVKMWITLLIPRIEDGNNFGVSIQEETLGEVRNVESEAASFLDQMSRYFTSRAKLLTKVAKYPHVEDYRRAILDMDEKQFINVRWILTRYSKYRIANYLHGSPIVCLQILIVFEIFSFLYFITSLLYMKDVNDFVFKNIQYSSICLAKVEKTTLQDVRRLLLNGLSNELESQPLNHNVRSTLIGIGNFLLYSHGKYASELIPILITALGIIPQMKWIDDGLVNKSDRIPIQEQFAFCFNTVLSDLAAHLPEYRNVIVSAQIDALACAVTSIVEILKDHECAGQSKCN